MMMKRRTARFGDSNHSEWFLSGIAVGLITAAMLLALVRHGRADDAGMRAWRAEQDQRWAEVIQRNASWRDGAWNAPLPPQRGWPSRLVATAAEDRLNFSPFLQYMGLESVTGSRSGWQAGVCAY